MYRILLLLALFCMCLEPQAAQAQTSPKNDLFLPAALPAGKQLPLSLTKQPLRAVRLNTELLNAAQPGQIVTIPLVDGSSLPLRLEYREVHIPGTSSWVGHIPGCDFALCVLSVVKDAVAFCLNTPDGKQFGLRYLENGLHLLYQLPDAPKIGCVVVPSPAQPTPPRGGLGIQAVNVVDTAICGTPQAVAALGGINAATAKAINCVVYMNNALNNSNSNAQVNLYAFYQVSMSESGRPDQQINRFRNLQFGTDLLNNGALDTICMFVSSMQGNVAGIGNRPGSYTVVATYDMMERTYAHEVGHNFGCGHEQGDTPDDPSSDEGNSPYSHGYSFYSVGQFFQSIMAYGVKWNGLTIRHFMQQFSNPGVSWFASPGIGGATGVSSTNDNARTMREYGSTIAAYGTVGANVYVDAANPLGSNGSPLYPYRTVSNGMNAVSNNGSVWIAGTRNYNERPITGKPMLLQRWSGTVTLGIP